METEVGVYFRHPELRPFTFNHPIWADAWIDERRENMQGRAQAWMNGPFQKAYEQALWKEQPWTDLPELPFWETLWLARRAATFFPQDAVERDFIKYESTANPFYETWRATYREVERHRQTFSDLVRQGKLHEAIALQEAYFETYADERGVPFGQASKAWHQVVLNMKQPA